jgi:hypothetical protein
MMGRRWHQSSTEMQKKSGLVEGRWLLMERDFQTQRQGCSSEKQINGRSKGQDHGKRRRLKGSSALDPRCFITCPTASVEECGGEHMGGLAEGVWEAWGTGDRSEQRHRAGTFLFRRQRFAARLSLPLGVLPISQPHHLRSSAWWCVQQLPKKAMSRSSPGAY